MAMSWHVWTPKVLSHCAKAMGSPSGSPARISLRFGSRLLSVFSDPAADELHVEDAITWDLRHGDAKDRVEPDPLPLVIVEARDLDRLILLAFVAITPQATNLRAPLTEKVLVVTGGADRCRLRVLAPFAPRHCPIATPTTRLAAQGAGCGLLSVRDHRPSFFRSWNHQSLPPSQCSDLTVGVAKQKVFCLPFPAWPVNQGQRCHETGKRHKNQMPLVLEPKCKHFGQVTSDNMENLFTSYVDPTQPSYSHMR